MRIFFVCLIMITTVHVSAQNVAGVVRNKATGAPLADVHILVNGKAIGTVTDQEGRFFLSGALSGSRLHISAVGFSAQVMDARDSLGTILLEPSAMILGNGVTITARRYETSSIDVMESATLRNRSDIDRFNFRTTPDLLANTTGIWMQKTNHGGGSPIIRGLTGNQVLLMVDGIRLNNATYRYGPNQYLNTIDPGSINQIEAIRGSGSVLYGSDAMGGVVNVISAAPVFADKPLFSGTIESRWVSSSMERSALGRFNFGNERVAATASFSHRDFGDLVAAKSIGKMTPSGYHQLAGDAKLKIRTGRKGGVLTGAWQGMNMHHVDRYDQVAQGGYSDYFFEPQQRQLSYLRWEVPTGASFVRSLRVTAAMQHVKEGLVSRKQDAVSYKHQSDRVNTASGSVEIKITPANNWESISGVEFYHDKVGSSARTINDESGESVKQRGAYADNSTASSLAVFSSHELDWRKFTFRSGLRYNLVNVAVQDPLFGNQEVTPAAITGNAGIAWRPVDSWQIIGTVNTAFRAPNVDDLSKFGPVESTVFEIPAAGLQPEKSTSWELAVRTFRKRFAGGVSGYYMSLSNLIDRVPTTWEGSTVIENRTVYQKQNAGTANIAGIEADAEFLATDKIIFTSNVTYTRGHNTTKNEPLRRIPPLFGKAAVEYRITTPFFAKAEVLFAGAQDRLAAGDKSDSRISVRLVDGKMPGWTTWNVHAGYTDRNVSVAFSWRNILDKAYRVYGSGVDGEGRNVAVTLRYSFYSGARR